VTTHPERTADEQRVLVLTPTGRDGPMTHDLLRGAGIDAALCGTLADVVLQIDRGAAALLVAEEAIADEAVRSLGAVLARQPPWSDLPVVVLTGFGADSESVGQALRTLGNVTLLERPTRITALISAVQTALRARARQYEIRAHMHDRERAAELLNEADRRKDEFLAMLAHELRNPLAPISNALQVLRLTGMSDPVAVRMCEVMQRQVDHMVRLVDDLLEVSRITRGKITLHAERSDLTVIIGNAVDVSRPLIDAAAHRLSIHMLDTPLLVTGDPIRLTQIFANLLNNAAKYTPERGKITLTAQKRDGRALVSVRDSGEGIAPEMLPRVFDLFTQAPPASAQAKGGLGIGLTLVRQLVELHGGSVEAFSEGPGRGSEFVVTLPLLVGEAADVSGPAEGRPADRPLTGRPVLVVDDNADGADSLGLLLQMLGADVRVVYDGRAALAALDAFQPSAVLLDVGMPELDGYEVARRMRARPGFEDLTIIAITGWGQAEDRARSREAGFDAHLTKPPDLEQVRHLLVSSGERRERQRARGRGQRGG
jgi:signal transduction histidine kinase/ActR/RegA family two-component response regulator